MFNKAEVCVFYTTVEPITSGTRIWRKEDKIVDINELHKCLNDHSKFVVICNDVSEHSNATEKQYFIVTDKCKTEESVDGEPKFVDSYILSHHGRSANGVIVRKIMMSFTDFIENPVLKCTYFSS